MLGQSISMLMPDPYRREHDQYMRAYRHTGQGKIIGKGRETVGRRKDGSVFPIDLSVSEVPLSDRRLFTGIIRDISSRKQIEEHRALLVAELSHRVKNTLATVISIARQTFPREEPFTSAVEAFDGRIRALAHTHSRLAERSWAELSLAEVIDGEISPHRNEAAANIRAGGPDVMLKPKIAISLGMAFHELITNAAKHGALSKDGGTVEISWDWVRPADSQLRIRWSERGGPEVSPPARSGFGRLLLERGLAHELMGKVQLEFAREGLKCTIVFPLDGKLAATTMTRPAMASDESPPLGATSGALAAVHGSLHASGRKAEGASQPRAGRGAALEAGEELSLEGLQILVVEDEFLLALEVEATLIGFGCSVVGPFAKLAKALRRCPQHAARWRGARHQPQWRDGLSAGRAARLRGIPFVFLTGYVASDIPERFRHFRRLQKPLHALALRGFSWTFARGGRAPQAT